LLHTGRFCSGQYEVRSTSEFWPTWRRYAVMMRRQGRTRFECDGVGYRSPGNAKIAATSAMQAG